MALGTLTRSVRAVLLQAGRWFLDLADRIPTPPLKAAVLTPAERELLQRNGVFRQRHAGRRCFVIGNGPSLGEQDLSPLAGEITYVTNSFFAHPVLRLWDATYHVLVDPVCFEDSVQAHDYLRSVAAASERTRYFVPLYFFRRLPTLSRVDRQGLLPAERTYFIALGGDKSLGPVTRFDPTAFLPPLLNVAQVCIALALYMGCSPIYLLGLDHDWLSRPGADAHFYQERPELEEALLPRNAVLLANYERQLDINERVWRGYQMLARAAARDGARIRNATKGGFLDVFPRAAYESVVGLR